MPSPKSSEAEDPASGSSARAASPPSSIEMPAGWSVAAQAMTTKKPMMPVSRAPLITSTRS